MNKLEFVHITKTGGTSIEDWGFNNGILWSFRKRKYFESKNHNEIKSHTKWHTPPTFFQNNPYVGKITFTVVRNPYTRIISEYYCPWAGSKRKHLHNKKEFNQWIVNLLNLNNVVSGLPQHLYLPIDNVLRYETLQQDFTNMIRKYDKQVDTTLPHSNKSDVLKKQRFTMDDIYPETIKLINKKYKRDFETFDYEML